MGSRGSWLVDRDAVREGVSDLRSISPLRDTPFFTETGVEALGRGCDGAVGFRLPIFFEAVVLDIVYTLDARLFCFFARNDSGGFFFTWSAMFATCVDAGWNRPGGNAGLRAEPSRPKLNESVM